MAYDKSVEDQHIIAHASALFPGSKIQLIDCPEDDAIVLDIDGCRYTFQIGSDDDEYFFTNGKIHFIVPLMDFDEDF